MRFVYSNIVYIFKLYNDFHIFRIDLYFFLLLLNFVWFSVIKFWADIFIELPTTLLLISYSSLQNYQTLFCMFVFFLMIIEFISRSPQAPTLLSGLHTYLQYPYLNYTE